MTRELNLSIYSDHSLMGRYKKSLTFQENADKTFQCNVSREFLEDFVRFINRPDLKVSKSQLEEV